MLNCGSSKMLKRLNVLIARFRDWEIWILSLMLLHVFSMCHVEILFPSAFGNAYKLSLENVLIYR